MSALASSATTTGEIVPPVDDLLDAAARGTDNLAVLRL
jgi:hypothetical protein